MYLYVVFLFCFLSTSFANENQIVDIVDNVKFLKNTDSSRQMSIERIYKKVESIEKSFHKMRSIRKCLIFSVIVLATSLGFYWLYNDKKKDENKKIIKKEFDDTIFEIFEADGSFLSFIKLHVKKGFSLAISLFVAKIVFDFFRDGKDKLLSFFKNIICLDSDNKNNILKYVSMVRGDLFSVQDFCFLYKENKEFRSNDFYVFEFLELINVFIFHLEDLLALILAFSRYTKNDQIQKSIVIFYENFNLLFSMLTRENLEEYAYSDKKKLFSVFREMNDLFFSFLSTVVNIVIV